MSALPGINVVGFVSGNLGLGVVARQVIAALLAKGHPVATLDLDAGIGRGGFDRSFEALNVASADALPHDITIWVLGAGQLVERALEICQSPALRSRFNAMYVWWELPHIPPRWRLAARACDALIAGSEFVQAAFHNALGDVPVVLAGTPVPLPDEGSADTARYRKHHDDFLAFTGFEPASDPMRKNPLAAIRAFQQAFVGLQRARLLIKLNNAGSARHAVAQVEALEAVAARDDRVVVIKDRLSYQDLLQLYGSCDVTISLHRSEGLGLMPLEGMRMGTPTISTGWSGNMTYMNHANSVPVRYDLVPVQEASIHYNAKASGVSSFWAEPSADHAAAALRWLAEDRGSLADLSSAARAGAQGYHDEACKLGFVDELVAMAGSKALRRRIDHAAVGESIRQFDREREWNAMSASEKIKCRVQWQLQKLRA